MQHLLQHGVNVHLAKASSRDPYWRSLLAFLAISLLHVMTLACGCEPSEKRREMLEWNERRSAEMAAQGPPRASGDAFRVCMAEKRPMLEACIPTCDSNSSIQGAGYDACLQACAKRLFGREIPMCSTQ